MSGQTSVTKSPLTSFVDIHQKEPSQSVAKKRSVGHIPVAKFENCFLKSCIVQLLRWPPQVKPAASIKKAISFSGLKSFTTFSV